MQATTRVKQVAWDPAGSNQFLVGGNGDLRLMEWEHTRTVSRFNTIAACTELGQLRSIAWSPHPHYPDLIAAGLHAGKIVLLRLNSSPFATRQLNANHGSGSDMQSALQISVRHSRPCNVVTFCHERPGLLAVGLEKGRGESLLIYDVEHSARALESGKANPTSTPTSRQYIRSQSSQRDSRGASPAQQQTGSSLVEPMPLFSLGSSESVSSATFLSADSSTSATSPLLVAGMSGKWLRVYDVRSPPTTASTWGSRAVHALAPNPYSGHQFVSAGDDGVIRLWDLRKPMDALMSWSEIDAGAVTTKQRNSSSGNQPRPIVEMEWNLAKRGELTALEYSTQTLRVWNMLDGLSVTQTQQQHAASTGASTTATALGMEGGDSSTVQSYSGTTDSIALPVLWDDRRPKAFQQPLTSFTYAVSPLYPDRSFFLGVSKDSTLGHSGHRLEIVDMPMMPHATFVEDGLLIGGDDGLKAMRIGTSTAAAAEDEDEALSPTVKVREILNRGRQASLAEVVKAIDRNETPRPGMPLPPDAVSGSITPRRLSRTRNETAYEIMNPRNEGGIDALKTDVSMQYRSRIARGYGSDPTMNASLSDTSLSEFWSWIGRAEGLARDGIIQDYDFRYRGVLSILSGFSSGSSSTTLSTTHSTPTPSPTSSTHVSSPRSIYSEFHRSLRERRDDQQSSSSSKPSSVTAAAFVAATGLLVSRRRLDSMGPISSSSFSSQRKLAIQCCGPDWEQEADLVCRAFVEREEYEKAARHAFFSGHLESAMGHLRGCEGENPIGLRCAANVHLLKIVGPADESLRVLAPLLAAFITQKETAGTDGAFAKLCRTLSSDAEKPWVRALFAFLASGGEWRELVDETGLALKDRVAIGLRFLSDSELLPFLQSLATEARATGDLEAIILLGLREPASIALLLSYIDRTSDLQTVALAASFVSPGILRNDRQMQRWVESYRTHLDRLQLYAPRALFDSARGRRARAAAEQARLAGRTIEANQVEATLRKLAPPQILIRCQYCSTNLGPNPKLSAGGGSNDGRGVGPIGIRSTVCPTCSKGFPGCAVCLKKPELHSVTSDVSTSLCWCQRCRHGGECRSGDEAKW